MENNNYQLQRFILAQEINHAYDKALEEIKAGRKQSHWIWYVFPQIVGLGYSSKSRYYGISSLEEATAYLENETLRNRLYEITNALMEQEGSAEEIFGGIDAIKVRSCMTLFDLVSPDDVFSKVLDKFYEGSRCERTLSIVKG
ncbi:MAG: DUF1810 domain-containing protein [Paludibacteraceae bacterium]|nr:DUF1810 domain-containing protein [Paludibacteraceae bacterium]